MSKDGISPNRENIRAVVEFPIPKCQKELHRFLGLVSYFWKFIKDFSIIAAPLYALIRKNEEFRFGQQELGVFDTFKNILATKPVLYLYSSKAETELHCDACRVGYGSILLQKQDDGRFHPIFYFSKRTTDQETRYHSYELECLAIIYAIKRFHVYLYGIPFKIVTDCDSFRLTLSKKDINPRIMRWPLFLENYNYEILHRPNARMRHVDALSRGQNILVVAENTFEQVLAIKQQTYPDIATIKKQLESAQLHLFELSNGLVYRKYGRDKLLFYVPKVMISNVIRSAHDDMAHVGIDKTCEIILQTYWFPNLKACVREYISNCLKCITYSPNSGKVEGVLHSIPKGTVPFDTIHIDHYGPLETCRNKDRYILVIVDGFTKFVKLYACRSTNTKEVAKHLRSYFLTYSKPNRIVSDRGSAFTSNAFNDFLGTEKARFDCHWRPQS